MSNRGGHVLGTDAPEVCMWLLLSSGRVCHLARKGRWKHGTVSWLTQSAERGSRTADVQGPRGCCPGERSPVANVFDHQAPSSVTSGPFCKLFSLSHTLCSLRKILFPLISYQPKTSNWKFTLASERPCVLTLSWLKSSQKQRNNGNNDRVISSWTFALCQTLFHVILSSGGEGTVIIPTFRWEDWTWA